MRVKAPISYPLEGTFLVFPIPFQLESDCKLRLGRRKPP